MSVVGPEIVKQTALLARLRLDGKALEHTASQLDAILSYVQQLQAVNTDGVEPTTHALPLVNVQRPDEKHVSLAPDEVVKMAPTKQPPFVAVPKVIETS